MVSWIYSASILQLVEKFFSMLIIHHFKTSYSSEDHLKAKEAMVVYNFNKFLKQVERKYDLNIISKSSLVSYVKLQDVV